MAAKGEQSWTKGKRREKSHYALLIGRRKTEVRLTFGKVVLGRHPKLCNIIFSAPLISRQHCGIVVTQDEITVQDLNSRNGTRVNGNLIQHAQLTSGDVITIGGVNIQVLSLKSEQAAPQASNADTDHNNSETEPLLPNAEDDLLPEDFSGEIPEDILNTMFDFDDD